MNFILIKTKKRLLFKVQIRAIIGAIAHADKLQRINVTFSKHTFYVTYTSLP